MDVLVVGTLIFGAAFMVVVYLGLVATVETFLTSWRDDEQLLESQATRIGAAAVTVR